MIIPQQVVWGYSVLKGSLSSWRTENAEGIIEFGHFGALDLCAAKYFYNLL